MLDSDTATWAIAALAIFGVIARPWRLPEFIWAVAGALVVVLIGAVPLGAAGAAIARGTDVYLFLIGMMLLSELARQEGLFDYLARHAVQWSRGSQPRLFAIVYGVGTLVTVFLSNDATAVVLTPAVAAAARAARVKPLPYLFVCAIIANALFLQAGRHPSPMFGSVVTLPAPQAPAASPLPRPRPVELTRSIDADPPEIRPV